MEENNINVPEDKKKENSKIAITVSVVAIIIVAIGFIRSSDPVFCHPLQNEYRMRKHHLSSPIPHKKSVI